MKKLLSMMLVLITVCAMVTGCSTSTDTKEDTKEETTEETKEETTEPKKEKIIIGTMATNLDSVNAGVPSLEEMGYEVEVVTFDDITMPNTALLEGSIDVNYYQHEFYMNAYNKENGTNFVMLEPKLTYTRIAAYSDKYANAEELPDGAMVTIPSDSTNMSRALLLLQDLGLITLEGDTDVYTITEIKDNPKNLQFNLVTGAQVVSTLPDVDLIVVYNKYWVNAGRDTKEAWLTEADRYEFAQGLVVNGENADEAWVQDLIDAYTSDATKKALEEASNGVYDVLF